MDEMLKVKGRSEDVTMLKACYRMFFSNWDIEQFPEWLKDMEDAVEGRAVDLPQPNAAGGPGRNQPTL